jgi:FkbM family methyltransferase
MSAELLDYPVVNVLPVALGGQPGKAKFAFASENESLVSQSLVGATVPTGTANIREVEVVTLATLMGRLKVGALPALVKLDVEGVEVDALKAAPPGWLSANGPLWVVECHPQALARFGTMVADVIGMFPAAEFNRFVVGKYAGSDGADLPPVPLDESALPPASFHNLIAVPLGAKWTDRRQALRPILSGR